MSHAYAIFFVAFVGSVKVIHRYVVILVQPLHHERLEPPAPGVYDTFDITNLSI